MTWPVIEKIFICSIYRDTSRKYTRTGDPREGAEAREAGTEAGAEYEAEADLETVTGPDVNNGDSPLPLDQVSCFFRFNS